MDSLTSDAVFLIAILAICSARASPKICSACRAGNTLVLRQFVKLFKLLAAGGQSNFLEELSNGDKFATCGKDGTMPWI